MDDAALLSLAGLAGATVTAVVAGLFARGRSKADSADLLTQAAQRIITDLQEQNEQLRAEIAELRSEVRRLHELIIRLGHSPYDGGGL